MLLVIKDFWVFPNLFYLIGAGILTAAMWWAESFRWLILVRRIVKPQAATLRRSFKAMISGQTLGMFIPYRIGKIGGRIIVYETPKKLELLVVNYFDSEAIKLPSDILGLLGAIYIVAQYSEMSRIWIALTTVLFMALIILRLHLFFNIKIALNWLSRFKIRKGILRKARFLTQYTNSELMTVLLVTGCRVLLNFCQYYLLLRFFHIDVPIIEAFVLIAGIYFFISNFPVPAIAGLFARIQLALYIWGHYTDNIISISSIPLILWILNALLSALVGAYYLMNTNIVRNIQLQNSLKS